MFLNGRKVGGEWSKEERRLSSMFVEQRLD